MKLEINITTWLMEIQVHLNREPHSSPWKIVGKYTFRRFGNVVIQKHMENFNQTGHKTQDFLGRGGGGISGFFLRGRTLSFSKGYKLLYINQDAGMVKNKITYQ